MVNKKINGPAALILNGSARSVRQKLVEEYKAQFGDRITIFTPQCKSEGKEIAHEIVEDKFGLVVTGGGDGTLYGIVNSIDRVLEARGNNGAHPVYAAKRHGTGNSIANQTGANKHPNQLEVLLDSDEVPIRQIPLIKATVDKQNEEQDISYFSFMGVGWDALIVNEYNTIKKKTKGKIPGVVGYPMAAVSAFFSVLRGEKTDIEVFPTTENVYSISAEGSAVVANIEPGRSFIGEEKGPINVAGVGTVPDLGFGFKAFPYALLAEEMGLMQLTMITGGPRTTGGKLLLPWNSYKIWKGKLRADCVNYFLVDGVRLEYTGNGVGADAEIAGDGFGKILGMTCTRSQKKMNVVDFNQFP